jgi:Fe-S-cluster-containing dehydrogenase component/CRP-like cAMP-binding protein
VSELAFSSALLRDVDARGRDEIMRAAREQSFAKGDYAYRAGEDSDSVFVCIEGAFAVSVPSRADASERFVRDALRGDAFGEEAILPFAARQASARAKEAARAVVIPAHLVRRALGRVGKDGHEERVRRAVMRALVVEGVAQCALFANATEREREAVVDASTVREMSRGEYVYRAGAAADSLYIVASGSLAVTAEAGGRPQILGYVSRGDAIGESEVLSGRKRPTSLFALGPARLVEVPARVVDRSHKPAVTRLTVLSSDALPTAHVLRDRHRFETAKSMLVIDSDTCVRCGHCSQACASVHADGVSRLLRNGEIFDVPSLDARLIAPTSCQHCKNPACMAPCPTGAIGREANGEVVIRAELCTGCGACAKGCPWDNITMAPRGKAAAPPGLADADLAVKCDLCATRDAGPACVASCPVSAITRIEPSRVIAELGAVTAAATPASDASAVRVRRIPIAAVLAAFAVSIAASRAGVPFRASGAVALGVLVVCVGYMFVKRVAFRFARKKSGGALAVAPHYAVHVVSGALLPGIALAHAHANLRANPGGLALASVLVAAATGFVLLTLQRLLPRVVSRAESKTSSDVDAAGEARALEGRLLAAVSGKSALTKTVYERVLAPYDRAFSGPLAFALAGRTLRDERGRLGKVIVDMLEGRGEDKRAELDEVVRVVVERRALEAKRWALFALRSTTVVHVLATTVALALALAHAAEALR